MDGILRFIILGGLLVGALITTVICLGVFTAKNNELVSDAHGIGVCLLFVRPESPPPDYNICQYATWGSATVMVLIAILGAHTVMLAVFKYTG